MCTKNILSYVATRKLCRARQYIYALYFPIVTRPQPSTDIQSKHPLNIEPIKLCACQNHPHQGQESRQNVLFCLSAQRIRLSVQIIFHRAYAPTILDTASVPTIGPQCPPQGPRCPPSGLSAHGASMPTTGPQCPPRASVPTLNSINSRPPSAAHELSP